jgi:hypothetical protein
MLVVLSRIHVRGQHSRPTHGRDASHSPRDRSATFLHDLNTLFADYICTVCSM